MTALEHRLSTTGFPPLNRLRDPMRVTHLLCERGHVLLCASMGLFLISPDGECVEEIQPRKRVVKLRT